MLRVLCVNFRYFLIPIPFSGNNTMENNIVYFTELQLLNYCTLHLLSLVLNLGFRLLITLLLNYLLIISHYNVSKIT